MHSAELTAMQALARPVREIQRVSGVEAATRRALLYCVVPLWLGSGLADWWHHRRTKIEDTSGARESVIHLLMLAEAGMPSLLGLFLEVNAGVLLSALAAVAAHEATAIWDVAYAEPRRKVSPSEQHVHSFLEVGPLVAVLLLGVLHWDQARSLVGRGPVRPDFTLRFKRRPLAPTYVAGLLVAIVLAGVMPYAEELRRCWRAKPTLEPQPVAPPR